MTLPRGRPQPNGKHGRVVDDLWQKLLRSRAFQKYLLIFLRRSYLSHYEELSKVRPVTEQAALWIGHNSAD